VCCLYGPDTTTGIFGCGGTEEKALEDWEESLKNRLINHPFGDPVAEAVLKMLDQSRGEY